MDGHDRLRARGDRRIDEPLVEVQRVLADVDEHGHGAAQRERVGGRRERERRHDHLVARPDLEQHRGELERRRARRRQQHPRRAEPRLELALAALGERSARRDVAGGDRLENLLVLVAYVVRPVERDVRRTV